MQQALSHPSDPPALPFRSFLSLLLTALEENAVRCCILRNYEEFPVSNAGSDIDFLISAAQLPQALRAIQSIDSVRMVGYLERSSVALIHLAGVSPRPGVRGMEVDFDLSLDWKGIPFLTTEAVLAAAIPRHAEELSFFIPCPVHEAIISLFASLLVGGFLKEKYFPRVQQIFAGERSAVIEALRPRFGSSAATRLANAVIGGERSKILRCVSPLRTSLALRSLLSKPVQSIRGFAQHSAREIAIRLSSGTRETIFISSPKTGLATATVEALLPMLQFSAWEVRGVGAAGVGLTPRRSLRRLRPLRALTLEIEADEPSRIARPSTEVLASHDLSILLCPSHERLEFNANSKQAILDADQPLDRIVEAAYAAIIDALAARTARKLKNRF
jgi:hypothetical protein